MSLILAALSFLFLVLRLVVYRLAQGAAVDEFYWAQYRDAARKQQNFPPILPQYLLDLRQWYPPLYGRFLKLLPDGLFKHRNRLNAGLSLFRFVNLFVLTLVLGVEIDVATAFLCLLIYLASPVLFSYDNQLNSRILASILFDVAIVVVFVGWSQGWHLGLSVALLFLYVTQFFLHKLTIQLQIFLCIVWAAILGELVPLSLLIATFFLSFLLGYKNTFKAHWDITAFWSRNRRFLSAHQIQDSPLYGKESRDMLALNTILRNGLTIPAMCPFVIIPLLGSPYSFWQTTILAALLFAFLVTFVPQMKAWGHGRSYMYYQPAMVILALLTSGGASSLNTLQGVAFVCCLPIVFYSLVQYKKWLDKKAEIKDTAFEETVDFIRESELNRIMCIPAMISDEVAHRSGKSVLWGGHGYGFKLIEPYFPVLRISPQEAVGNWNAGAVIIDKSYWPDHMDEFPSSVFRAVMQKGSFIVYAVNNWRDGWTYPQSAKDCYPGLVPDKQRS